MRVSPATLEAAVVALLTSVVTSKKTVGNKGNNQDLRTLTGAGRLIYRSFSDDYGPYEVDVLTIPQPQFPPTNTTLGGPKSKVRVSRADLEGLQFTGVEPEVSTAVQNLDGSEEPVGKKPKLRQHFESISAVDCCNDISFATNVPPDPDLAVGPNHVIAVTNRAFEIYDKMGNSLTKGPVGFSQFFDPTFGGTNPDGGTATLGCPAYQLSVFDPDVVYDVENDRYILGIDGGGTAFCIAASVTGDPTGLWYRYAFPANINNAFFDFPHMGIGANEIFIGSNQFGGDLAFGFEGRVFAVDKHELYSGNPSIRVATREVAPTGLEGSLNVKLDGTPQPAQTPTGPAHYIMTETFNGAVHSVYSWEDPFGDTDVWSLVGDVDLAEAAGVPCPSFACFPIASPQKGSTETLTGNDYRGHETKVGPDGTLWTTQTIACNPGKGTRNCIRWAQIDVSMVQPAPDQTAFPLLATTDGVIQAGVIGSDWGYRSYPSLAVNKCGDMAIGYTKTKAAGNSGGSLYPSIFVTGRKKDDPPGQIGGEVLLRKGDEEYKSFQQSGIPWRWGDYTGMQSYNHELWYIGQYAGGVPALPGGPLETNWGTYIGKFTMPGCK